jgi:hypothetical protein
MQPCKPTTPFAALEDLPASVLDVLVSAFDADVARLVYAMGQAWRERDSHGFRFAALSLAGVAGTFGVPQLEVLARQSLHSTEVAGTDLLSTIEAAAMVARQEIRQAFHASSH